MAGNTLIPKGRELPHAALFKEPDPDPLREFEVTVPELERLVKRSTGRVLFVRAGWAAHAIDQNGVEPGKFRCWDISGNVDVPKRTALRFIANAYTERARAAVYARITFNSHCLFIGG